MKIPARNCWIIVFGLLTLADITSIALDQSLPAMIIKPLLMPVLFLLLLSGHNANNSLLIKAGLFFSWAGDILLMFEDRHPLFFISGLASFLVTHLCYILYFIRIPAFKPSLLKQHPWIVALIAGYGVSLVMLLLPHLGEMKLPVVVYAIVICNMLIFSLHVYRRINRPANFLFVAGALFFTLSDSILAINKFYQPFPAAGVFIMLTYCAAQFCIVLAAIKRAIV